MTSYDEQLALYMEHAWDDTPALFYEKRGLTHSTVSRFNLGYTADMGKGKKLDLRDCLVLPYEDGMGRVRSLRYRPLYDAGVKYLSVEKSTHLFAVRATDNPVVVVCEGEIDTMTAWQCGYRAVGLPGASAWKDEWRWLFRNSDRVILALDPDEAGIIAARRLYQSLEHVVTVEVARLPEGYDLNDLLVKHGEDAVREILEA